MKWHAYRPPTTGTTEAQRFIEALWRVTRDPEVLIELQEKEIAELKLRIVVPKPREIFSNYAGKYWRKGGFAKSLTNEWLRHRPWAIQLKHWKRGKTMYRELLQPGATPLVAQRVAASSTCWWRNANRLLKTVLTIAYFDQLGVPRLS